MSEAQTYECACCLEQKPESNYYKSKDGKRYMTCKDCKRMQQKLCKRLTALGYNFGIGLFASLERTKVIQMLLESGVLKHNEVPRTSLN